MVKSGKKTNLKQTLVLASASPRRLALLQQAGIEPDILRPVSIDETPRKGELPRNLVWRLSKTKAFQARDLMILEKKQTDCYILAADTIVAVGRRIITKPEFVEDAIAALQLLSGRAHKVYTGICLILSDGQYRQRIVETKVRFKRLSHDELDSYLASREWRGKAGGYAIQGLAGTFVKKLVGSYTNVVGLPLYEVVSLLNGEGFSVHFNWLRNAEIDLE
ncbi:MAG: Maf-like protein [Pseudomonadota bacterium]